MKLINQIFSNNLSDNEKPKYFENLIVLAQFLIEELHFKNKVEYNYWKNIVSNTLQMIEKYFSIKEELQNENDRSQILFTIKTTLLKIPFIQNDKNGNDNKNKSKSMNDIKNEERGKQLKQLFFHLIQEKLIPNFAKANNSIQQNLCDLLIFMVEKKENQNMLISSSQTFELLLTAISQFPDSEYGKKFVITFIQSCQKLIINFTQNNDYQSDNNRINQIIYLLEKIQQFKINNKAFNSFNPKGDYKGQYSHILLLLPQLSLLIPIHNKEISFQLQKIFALVGNEFF